MTSRKQRRPIRAITMITPTLFFVRNPEAECTLNLLGALTKHTRVSLIANGAADLDRLDRRVRAYPLLHTWTFREMPLLLRIVRRTNPDVVLMQITPFDAGDRVFLQAAMLAIRTALGRPIVLVVHDPHWEYRLEAQISSVVISVDEVWREMISRANPRTYYVPIAPTIPRVVLDAGQKAAVRRSFNLPLDRQIVSFFGHTYPRKGFPLLVEAVRRLRRDRPVVLLHVGRPDPQYADLDWVRATGVLPKTEAARLLAASDVCAQPYLERSAWCSSALLGALSQDIPVVTTGGLGVRMPGLTYVPPGDVDALVDALQAALALPFTGRRYLRTWANAAREVLAVAEQARSAPPPPLGAVYKVAAQLPPLRRLSAASWRAWRGARVVS